MKFSDLFMFDSDAGLFDLLVPLRKDRVKILPAAILLVERRDKSGVTSCAHEPSVETYKKFSVFSIETSSLRVISEQSIIKKEKKSAPFVCGQLA